MRKNNAKRAKIVAAINAGQMTTSEIAREFGTTYQYVYSIKYAMKGKELASDSTEEQLSLPLDGELPPAVVKLRAELDAQSVAKKTEAVNHPPTTPQVGSRPSTLSRRRTSTSGWLTS